MKGNTVLQWFALAIWLGFVALGLAAEVAAIYEIFIGNIQLGAEALFWSGLYNAPFLLVLMVAITVIRRNSSIRVAPEAAVIYALGFFGHVIGAAMIMSGALDATGARMIAIWSALFQYGAFLWMIFGPRVLNISHA